MSSSAASTDSLSREPLNHSKPPPTPPPPPHLSTSSTTFSPPSSPPIPHPSTPPSPSSPSSPSSQSALFARAALLLNRATRLLSSEPDLPPTVAAFLPVAPANARIRCYAAFKQATSGPNTNERPPFYQGAAREKHDGWALLGDMGVDEARKEYLDLVTETLMDAGGRLEGDERGREAVTVSLEDEDIREKVEELFAETVLLGQDLRALRDDRSRKSSWLSPVLISPPLGSEDRTTIPPSDTVREQIAGAIDSSVSKPIIAPPPPHPALLDATSSSDSRLDLIARIETAFPTSSSSSSSKQLQNAYFDPANNDIPENRSPSEERKVETTRKQEVLMGREVRETNSAAAAAVSQTCSTRSSPAGSGGSNSSRASSAVLIDFDPEEEVEEYEDERDGEDKYDDDDEDDDIGDVGPTGSPGILESTIPDHRRRRRRRSGEDDEDEREEERPRPKPTPRRPSKLRRALVIPATTATTAVAAPSSSRRISVDVSWMRRVEETIALVTLTAEKVRRLEANVDALRKVRKDETMTAGGGGGGGVDEETRMPSRPYSFLRSLLRAFLSMIRSPTAGRLAAAVLFVLYLIAVGAKRRNLKSPATKLT